MNTKLISLICGILFFCALSAQNYQIVFSGTGASTTVDIVQIENLTQCTSIEIGGSDILNLVQSTGISRTSISPLSTINVYPNPAVDICFFDFDANIAGSATISISDMSGKRIFYQQKLLPKGHNIFQLKGIKDGIYTLRVESPTYYYNSKIIGIGGNPQNIELMQIESIPEEIFNERTKSLLSEKTLTQMQYNEGDLLKITGKSGAYRTVFMLVAENSQTVNFEFIPCTDGDANSYAIVKIGNQWWMAENLNAGTFVSITTPQVSGTKFCQDVNGHEDPSCPMGGLYEWHNVLQGASACNGSGAPPNDKCATPVQGLCPNGWHVPSHYELTTLERNSGSSPDAFPYNVTTVSILGTNEGANLKEACSTNWWAPNAGATNKTGFSALPGGDTWNGVYEDFGQSCYIWTTTETFFMAWVRGINYSLTNIGRSYYAVESGFTVRCLKD